MIKNERQYKITKAQLHKFEEALSQIIKADIAGQQNVLLRQLHVDALQSQIEEFKEEIQDYESLISKPILHELSSIEALPSLLIKARIAAKLTQKDLAKQLGLKEQQIQKYEATDYSSASLSRIIAVSQVLDIKFPHTTPKVKQFLKKRRSSVDIIKKQLKILSLP